MSRVLRIHCAAWLAMFTLWLPGTVLASSVLLDAHFDNLAPGALGEGGAEVGEPVEVPSAITATVVAASPSNNYLRIQRSGTTNAARLNFALLDDAVVDTGLVNVSVRLRPSALDQYSMHVRTGVAGSNAAPLSLSFGASGLITIISQNGNIATASYLAGQVLEIELSFDLGADTHSVWINGAAIYENQATGNPEHAIGAIRVGYSSGGSGSLLELDDLAVLWSAPTGDDLLHADFNLHALGQPVGARGPEYGEPVALGAGLVTEVVAAGTPQSRAMRLARLPAFSDSQAAVWEFLDGASIDNGRLNVSMRLMLQNQDSLQLALTDAAGGSRNFSTLTFTSFGNISAADAAGYIGNIGTYTAGQYLGLRYAFDMNAGTVTLSIDGTDVITDRAYGVTGFGLGRIELTVTSGSSTGSPTLVDDLVVVATGQIGPPEVAVSKTASPASGTTVMPLQPIAYTVAVDIADGPLTAALVLSDLLDGDAVFGSVTGNNGFTLQQPYNSAELSLPSGTAPGHYEFRYTATVSGSAAGPIESSLSVLGGGGDDSPTCDPCQTQHPLVPTRVEVVRTSSPASGGEVVAGQAVDYRVTVTIADASLSSALMLRDSLSANLAFDRILNANGAFDTATTANPLEFALPQGTGTGQYTLVYRAYVAAGAQVGDVVTTSVTVASGGGDPNVDCGPCATLHTVAESVSEIFKDGFE